MSAVAAASAPVSARPTPRLVRDGAVPGAIAGVVGGIAFGASMIELGDLESIASLVRADSASVGALVHMVVALLVGAVFGMLVVHQRATAADTLAWGTTYGAFFWFVGPLTLRPLILGTAVRWDVAEAQARFGSLIGHIVWGAVAGLTLAALRAGVGPWRSDTDAAPAAQPRTEHRPGSPLPMVALGALAGVVGALVLTALLPAANDLTAPVAGGGSTNWIAVSMLGAITGALYALLVPSSSSPASPRVGARVMQGLTLGFLAWIVVALTVVPLAQIDTLAWSDRLARDRFDLFPGYLLFGVLVPVLFCSVAGGARFLFSDEVRHYDRLTAGPQRLRAVIRGALAGVLGGLLFTIVMVQVGALGRVSRLVGAESPVVGFFVHMAIAVLIGVTYALLFRRLSFDARSGIGWGLAYGLLWWILGALTLLPLLLGGNPQWSADQAARAFPALVGHLAYGAGLGAAFFWLEARYSPWWISRNEAEADRTRARREQVLTSAPASWSFVVFAAFFVALILAPN